MGCEFRLGQQYARLGGGKPFLSTARSQVIQFLWATWFLSQPLRSDVLMKAAQTTPRMGVAVSNKTLSTKTSGRLDLALAALVLSDRQPNQVAEEKALGMNVILAY